MANIGIDIGTSYSSVCILDGNNQPERVKVATGIGMFGDAYSLPSAVFAEPDGRLLLGQTAVANRMRLPENFKSEFKRDLGQQAPYVLGDKRLLPEDLYKEFFIYLKHCVEEYTQGEVTEATITCPAVFNKNKMELIRNAAKKAGLLQVSLLDEPSAAACCYLHAGKLKEGDTLLVYDLGGGTFDVALLWYANGEFRQLAQPQGLGNCGGADFDRLVFEHMLETIGEELLEALRAKPSFFKKFVTQLMETAVKAKHYLSSAEVYKDVIPVGFEEVEYSLTRSGYNAMIGPIVDETMQRVAEILNNAEITVHEVTHVLLVGGSSRTPLIRERLTKLMGREPLRDIDPELAVCAGAAVYGLIREKREQEHRKSAEEEERRREDARRAEEEAKRKAEEEQRRVEEARRKREAEAAEEERRRNLELETLRRQVELLEEQQKQQAELVKPKKAPPKGKLFLKRKLQFSGIVAGYKVFIDGKEMEEKIRANDMQYFELEYGKHILQIKAGFTKSKEFVFSLTPDEAEVTVQFHIDGWGRCVFSTKE